MAGPVASVLLKSAPNPETIDAIHTVIDRMGQERDGGSFYVPWPSGAKASDGMRPFIFDIIFLENDPDYDEEKRHQMEEYLGFYPTWEVGLYAMGNDDEDHKILGLLALQIAQAVDGYIDFNGALPAIHIKNIPGSVYPLSYDITDHTRGVTHVSDTQFLRNWLDHEHFRMIK